MFELNGTYVLFILSFLAFIWALNEVMLKPVGKVIEERAALIKSDVEAGKQARADAEAVVSQYQKRIHDTRLEAQSVINDAAAEAQKKRDDEIKVVQDQGRHKLEEAKAALAVERRELIDGLVDQEVELVGMIVNKLTGEAAAAKPDREKVRRALEEAC